MNLPNKLATLRMILIIPFVFFLEISLSRNTGTALSITMRILAFLIFVGASVTDYYDGHIARKYNMVTNLGKLIDPLADKLLVISALVVLTKYSQISLWIVLVIIFRELLITGLRAIVAAEGTVIAAETLGKLKTVSQMVILAIIILIPLKPSINNMLLMIPLLLTVVSGIEYVVKSKDVLVK